MQQFLNTIGTALAIATIAFAAMFAVDFIAWICIQSGARLDSRPHPLRWFILMNASCIAFAWTFFGQ